MIDRLLEELIKIAGKTKTDFALHMNMAPSGLSKILTGRTLPPVKDRKQFIQQAANYFSEVIYSHGCYLKFKNIFPVIYDFDSLEELNEFLASALTYALDMACLEESKINLNFNNRSISYVGKQLATNQLCILLSYHAIYFSDKDLELFVSLPFSDPGFLKVFNRIVLIGIKESSTIILNFYLDSNIMNEVSKININNILSSISNLDKYFDLNFYEVRGDDPLDFFILLKGHLLLLFNSQIDGAPILLPIFHKSYISIFYNSLFKKNVTKISYSQSEAISFLTENPQFVSDLLEKGVKSVYNFMSIGYLITDQELASTQSNPIICDSMSKLFRGILTDKPAFIVSQNALGNFSSVGHTIVPLIGTLYFTPEHRITYMQRLNDYLFADKYSQLEIIDSSLTNVAILFSKDLCLVYTSNNAATKEKIHAFKISNLDSQLYNEFIERDCLITDFSSELWNSYQDKLQHIADEHP